MILPIGSPGSKLEMAMDIGLNCAGDHSEKTLRRPSWRWVQSAANPSPCYVANIRVIFENNSDPAVKNAESPCGAGTCDHRANFDNREKQGGSLQSNTVPPAKKQSGKTGVQNPPTSPARLPSARRSARFVTQDVGGSRPDDDNPLVDMGCGL